MTTQPSTTQRRPHAVLDLESRRLKALKIETLLDLHSRNQPMRLLEVGTGSGGIAHYFGTHSQLCIEVDAVDVVDNRLISDGYRFRLVDDTNLPFDDRSFDVVLTNHVIEHVGSRAAQAHHLAEIRRVLRHDGIGYLAVPNRWQVVEPHYQLAFLSWWPPSLRSTYLRWRRGIGFYDCEPLTVPQVEELLSQAGFEFAFRSVAALRHTLALEYPKKSLLRNIGERVPDATLRTFGRLIPTLIYTFAPRRV